MKHLLVVCGTGTEVGKTHIAVRLVSALAAKGVRVAGLKPVESGVERGAVGPDQLALASASSTAPTLPPPYVFREALSPHLAARFERRAIEVGAILPWITGHAEAADVLVVETAGGLLSPLGPGVTNLELLAALRPTSVVLSGRDRLGVLHEVGSAMRLLRAELGAAFSASSLCVILQPPALKDASTGTNAGELETLGIAPRAFAAADSSDDGAESILAYLDL